MKKVSAKLFFTVMWRGICQGVTWFLGLFGFKHGGKFAKIVWGVFATSAAVFMALLAFVLLSVLIEEANLGYSECDDPECYESTFVSRDIYYHDHGDGKGYIYNSLTGEKTLKHIAWIAKPLGDDSLVCYSDGKKRGYFNKYTGKEVIPAKYDHAWIFSDGLASVEEGGFIKFIDATGKVVFDPDLKYQAWMDGYVFHGGYCVIYNENNDLYGLIDKSGKTVLSAEFTEIQVWNDSLICVERVKEMGVFDSNLNPVIPLMECHLTRCDEMIEVNMPDHTIRMYDLAGNLLDDCYIVDVRMLEYETDAIVYVKPVNQTAFSTDDECEWSNGVDDEESSAYYHPKATARLRAYSAGSCYEGLMTADGHVVTKPSYTNIEAIGPDLYLCEINNSTSVVLNGKGQIVK